MASCSPIAIRWIISMLGIYACALVYTQRAGMSVAIVAMTTASKNSNNQRVTAAAVQRSPECAEENAISRIHASAQVWSPVVQQRTNRSAEFEEANYENKPEFEWNEKLQGVILGSQFYLYIVIPTIAGRATDIFGGKWVAFAGALGPCILSAITPLAVRAGGGAGVLIAIRTLMGAFHGCVYPAMFSLYTKWFPVRERANANAGLSFGGGLGSTVMYLLGGWLCGTEVGWPAVFYANTVLYIPWMVLWLWCCTNDPSENRLLSEKEVQYIETHIPKATTAKKVQAKWIKIFTSVPVLCSLITKMCAGFGYFLLLTKMPSYLSTIFAIDIFKNGTFNATATLAQGVCGLLAAPLSNWIIKRTQVRSIIVRKVFQSVAMMGPALCLCMIPVFGCNSTGVIVMLIGAMLLYGCFTGGEWTTISEYAPNSAGTVFGFANILAFASGVFAPYIVGILLDSENASNRDQWNLIFYITAGIYLFGAITFMLFGTDRQQAWDRAPDQQPQQQLQPSNNGDSFDSIGSDDTVDIEKLKVTSDNGEKLKLGK